VPLPSRAGIPGVLGCPNLVSSLSRAGGRVYRRTEIAADRGCAPDTASARARFTILVAQTRQPLSLRLLADRRSGQRKAGEMPAAIRDLAGDVLLPLIL
jgi:hypothetical protein